jgi:hypothetical protein
LAELRGSGAAAWEASISWKDAPEETTAELICACDAPRNPLGDRGGSS